MRDAGPHRGLRLPPGPFLLSLGPTDPAALAALTLAGAAASWLNVVAGGGSFLTLTLLILLGMPAGVANGTNRVGILAQNLWAVWGFGRRRVLDWRLGAWAAVPATLGAALGARAALSLGDDTFRRILTGLMLLTALATLAPSRDTPPRGGAWPGGLYALGFFASGLYGGFVQAGVGFLMLAVTTLAGIDLVRGNAIKVLCALAFTPVAVALFWSAGKVEWGPGLALALGSVLGAGLGVRFTVRSSQRVLRLIVNLALVGCAPLLWFG